MRYFDLHCDTICEKAKGNKNTAVDLNKADFDEYIQCHAIFQNDSISGKAAFEKAKGLLKYYREHLVEFENEKCKSILTLENGVCLGDDLNNIAFWAKNGARICSLTWNGKNKLGYGADHHSQGGLTKFGFDAVSELENNNIIVDVSHLNDDGFFDVARKARKPFAATHSNCYSLCQHKRNLTDEQIREIISCGGVIGVCFYPLFLGKGNVFDLIYEHVYKILDLGGENCVCFGSDFDGASMSEELNSIADINKLYLFFKSKGFDEDLTQKIFFKNGENFLNKCFT